MEKVVPDAPWNILIAECILNEKTEKAKEAFCRMIKKRVLFVMCSPN